LCKIDELRKYEIWVSAKRKDRNRWTQNAPFLGGWGTKKSNDRLSGRCPDVLGNKKTLPTQESFTLYPKCEMVICRPRYGSKTGYPLKAFFTTLPPTLPFPKRAEKLPKACPIFSAFNYSVL